MPPQNLLKTPPAIAGVGVDWISPLKYTKISDPPSLPSPPPPPVPGNASNRHRHFISHDDAVRLIGRQSDPQKALDVFNAAAAQPGFNHNADTYSALLLNLARRGRLVAVTAVLRRMSLEPCRFDEPIFLRLMPFFARRADLAHQTLDLFHSISSIGRRTPSQKAVASCLDLLLVNGRPDLAHKLVSAAKIKFCIEMNTCICNIVVKHHCRRGNVEFALQMVEEMRKSEKAMPNVVTYSTLMGGLCQQGRLKEAFQVFEEMIDRDKVVPDQLTYNVLINGFCKNGQPDKARTIFGFMRNNDCEPNMFNYTALMNGYCKGGRVEEAKEVLEEMERMGLEIDAVTYTTLISCLCREGRVDEGIKLVNEMREKGAKLMLLLLMW